MAKAEAGILNDSTPAEQAIIDNLISPFDHPQNWLKSTKTEEERKQARLWPFCGEGPVDSRKVSVFTAQLAELDARLLAEVERSVVSVARFYIL